MGCPCERLERAIALKNDGQYDPALAEIRQILDEDPEHAKARHQLGLIYGFTGLFDESLEELQRAAELAPGNLAIRNDLGLTYAMLGMNDEAEAAFRAVLAADPTDEVALKNIAFFE